MLMMEDLEIAAELKRRLEKALPIVALRVFGSRARGEAAPAQIWMYLSKLRAARPNYAGKSTKLPGK